MSTGNIVPRSDGQGSLGTANKKWDKIYVNDMPLLTNTLQSYVTNNALSTALATKADNSAIPTKVSDLQNDSAFITKAVNDLTNYYTKNETYTQTEIDNKLSLIPKFGIEVVTKLPTSNISDSVIYLLTSGEETNNLYTEYIHVNNGWEILGRQYIDISGKSDVGHKHASNDITAMTGYSKASSTAAIAASDSLNTAIGKLEKALDGKQAAGSYLGSEEQAVDSAKLNGQSASYYAKASDIQVYTSGTGINVKSDNSINLTTSGVTANTYGPNANVTGSDGTTIKVPAITVDAYGRITNVTEYTLTNSDKNSLTGVKGSNEQTYRTGNVNITASNIGLGNVDNTADADKNVLYADSAGDSAKLGGSDAANYAKLSGPTFTGEPKAPTATKGTNTTQLATTEFVQTAISDVNTDAKVSQKKSTANATYPVLIAATANATNDISATNVQFGTGVKINPSTSEISATTFKGNLSGTANKATNDSDNNPINTTYAPLASPNLTGTPTAPTATAGTNTTQIATTEFANTAATNANTHYTTKLIAGGSTSTGNATTTNGNTYLRLFDDSTARNSINIVGDGATSVTSDTTGKITISSTNTTYSDATTSTHGLMSTSDKSKLDNIENNANNYSLPAATSSTLGGVIVGSNISNSDGTISLSSSNVTNALGFTPMNSTTGVNNVTQNVSTANNTYPILATNTANKTTSSAGTSVFSTKIKMNPSTGNISATSFTGNLTGTASKATNDSDDNAINTTYAKLASPNLTGTPTAPTATAGTKTTQIATTAFVDNAVDTAINNLIGSAPGTLDTLEEIADAINNDATVYETLNNAITNKQDKHDALTSISGLTTTANKMLYTTASNTYATATVTEFARSILDDADAAAVRTTIGALSTSGQAADSAKLGGSAAANYAKLSSPAFTGTPTAPTATAGTKTTQIATTEFVQIAAAAANTDTKVAQKKSTANATYPILIAATADATGDISATNVQFGTGVKINPSTSNITATTFTGALSGNATSATKATNDSDDNAINTTYAKLASPNLTGTPTAPTAAAGTNTTQIATTEFANTAAAAANTHYTTKLIAGGSTSTGNATTTNGNTYLRLFDDSTARNSINITGSGATSVTSNNSGVITISSTNTTYSDATTSTHGLMSTSDKSKLDGIDDNANNYSLPAATSSTLGGVIVGSNISNSDGTISLSSSNVTNALGFTPMNSTTGVNNVSQTVSTTNATYPILATNTADKTSSSVGTSVFSTKIKMNPSTGNIAATSFTGDLTGTATNATQLGGSAAANYAKLASPELTGAPTAPTATAGTNTTQIATTEFANTAAANANTHYTTKLIAGISTSTGNAASTNGNTYLRLFDDSTARNSINIVGDGATSVTSNSSGKITISSTNTTYSDATTSTHGLMSTSDKSKLNGIAENANNYSLPAATSSSLGGVIVGSNISNSDGTISLSSSNVTNALGFTPMNSTTGVNNVTQNVSTTSSTYPILATNTADKTTSSAGTSIFSTKIKMNPSTGVITATSFTGNLTGTASNATTLATTRNLEGVKFNGDGNITHYGSCSTAAATTEKAVSCNNFELTTGARIIVKFTVTNTAGSPTLNVNSTGAKAIYYRGSAIAAGYLAANRTYEFVYNGTQYELVGDINVDTDTHNNYVGYTSTTDNNAYPMLFKNSTGTTTTAAYARFNSGITVNPSTGTVTATNFAGKVNNHTVNVDVPSDAVFTDTTYSAGTGISLSGTTFSNSGVRSIATGTANGTISVNTNGTTANVSVYGLGDAAYKAVTTSATNGSTALITSGAVYTGLSGKANSSHNQASNTITAMTSYSKPSTTSAITTSDSLNAAIGKLEKGFDLKKNSTTLARSTAYVVGDHLFHASLGKGLFLECIQAGTTGSSEPSL